VPREGAKRSIETIKEVRNFKFVVSLARPSTLFVYPVFMGHVYPVFMGHVYPVFMGHVYPVFMGHSSRRAATSGPNGMLREDDKLNPTALGHSTTFENL
jgi:hypothetical protein